MTPPESNKEPLHDVENPPLKNTDDTTESTERGSTASFMTSGGAGDSSSSSSSHHAMERRLGEIDPIRLQRQSSLKSERKSASVTVFARHTIQPGKEHLFANWIQEISQLQKEKYPGYGGVQVVKPTCHATNQYVSIFRYDNYDLLQSFMNSDDRRNFLEKTCEFEAAPIELTYHSLEYWFLEDGDTDALAEGGDPALNTPPRPPSKWKMVIVIFLLIWLQTHFLRPAVGEIPKLPPLAKEALTVFLTVLGMTYAWMPIVTQYILKWWLFPKK